MKLREMLTSLLAEALASRFPNRGLRLGPGPDAVASFPAAHPTVGDVGIEASDEEVTVFVGSIAHGHFDQFNSDAPPDQVAQSIVEEVVEFLTALFADRVLLWSAPDGRSAGWQLPFEGTIPSDVPAGASTWVWSGPITGKQHGNPTG